MTEIEEEITLGRRTGMINDMIRMIMIEIDKIIKGEMMTRVEIYKKINRLKIKDHHPPPLLKRPINHDQIPLNHLKALFHHKNPVT